MGVPQKSFSGSTHGHFQELEQGTAEFVHLERKTGVLVMLEAIRHKAQELIKSHNITRHRFKANKDWCVCMRCRQISSLFVEELFFAIIATRL
jgi:hypothetical protein